MNCDKLTQSVSDKIESKVTGVCSCAAAANTWIIAETALFTILSLPPPSTATEWQCLVEMFSAPFCCENVSFVRKGKF